MLLDPFLREWAFHDHKDLEELVQVDRVVEIGELSVMIKCEFKDPPQNRGNADTVDGSKELVENLEVFHEEVLWNFFLIVFLILFRAVRLIFRRILQGLEELLIFNELLASKQLIL